MPATSPLGLASDNLLHRIAFDLLGDPDLADETVQLTRITAAAQAPRDPRATGAWLRRIATRRALRLREDRARRERLNQAAAAGRDPSAPATVDVVAHEELAAMVTAAVDRLDGPFRDVVRLRYFDGLAPREIAARRQIPVATVRSRLQRAMQKMRGDLDRRGPDPRVWRAALAPLAMRRARAVPWAIWTTLAAVLVTAGTLLVTSGHPAPAAAVTDPGSRIASQGSPVAATGGGGNERATQRTELPTAAADPKRRRARLPAIYVQGTVVDERGAPVPDATIFAGAHAEQLTATDTKTDAWGQFSILFDSRDMTCYAARPDGYRASPTVRIVPAGTKTVTPVQHVTLRVARGAMTVRGRVTRPDGRPAVRVRVRAGRDPLAAVPRRAGPSSAPLVLATRTDATGQFELTGLPPGWCHVAAESHDDLAGAHTTVTGDPGDEVTVDLRLALAADLTVLVRDAATGRPLAARVSYAPAGTVGAITAEASVDDGLAFLEAIPAGTDCRLRIETEDGRRAERVVRARPGAGNAVTVELPSATGATVRGTVHVATGEPLLGVVRLRSSVDPARTWMTHTDDHGAFAILGAPPVFDLEVLDDAGPDQLPLWFRRGMRHSDAALSLVVDYAETGELTGHLILDGRVPEGIDLRLQHESQALSARIAVDSDGEFYLDGAPPGIYQLVAITEGRTWCDLGRVELQHGTGLNLGAVVLPTLGAVEFADRGSADPGSTFVVRNTRGVAVVAGRGRLPARMPLAPGRYHIERDGGSLYELEVRAGVTTRR